MTSELIFKIFLTIISSLFGVFIVIMSYLGKKMVERLEVGAEIMHSLNVKVAEIHKDIKHQDDLIKTNKKEIETIRKKLHEHSTDLTILKNK